MKSAIRNPQSAIHLGPRAQLALDTLMMRPTLGLPAWMAHVMQISEIEHFGGHAPGEYKKDPHGVYLDFQHNAGVCFIDQFIPENPLKMGDEGYREDTPKDATTGAERIVLDGIAIDSPEAVVRHLDGFVFPALEQKIAAHDPDDPAPGAGLIDGERATQRAFGPNILKVPYYEFFNFPRLRYRLYGYENYFLAYLMYPEIMERDFALQADMATRENAVAARAIRQGGLPPIVRLDHDMADGRSTLVDVRSLDRLWFPHFARSIQPFLDADIRLLWHCDGNLMEMVPRLIEAGIGGFQGFQYEFQMDYEKICSLRDRDGGPLQIWAGASVTTTLPHGTPDDVRRELRFLVEHGPPVGLCLGCSSSVVPGTPRENLAVLFEGLAYYREHGRKGVAS